MMWRPTRGKLLQTIGSRLPLSLASEAAETDSIDSRRRQLLALLGTTPAVTLAGCLGGDKEGAGGDTSTQRTESGNTETSSTEPTDKDGSDTGSTTPEYDDVDETDQSASSLLLQQVAKLATKDGTDLVSFGNSVDISADGRTAVIGANNDLDLYGTSVGSAFVFTESGGTWHQQTTLVPETDPPDDYGESVAVSSDGRTAIVGAPRDDNSNGESAGSAFIFTQSDGSWQKQAKVVAGDGDDEDLFGQSVAISDDGSTAVVGALADEDPHGELAGSAYVFTESSGNWHEQAKLVADDGEDADFFGFSLAVSGDGSTVIVGAVGDKNSSGYSRGAVYVFESNGGWQQQSVLIPADVDDLLSEFGSTVAVSRDGRTVMIGAAEGVDQNQISTGSAYVFTKSGRRWQEQAKLLADDGKEFDEFGATISVTNAGGTVIIGAPRDENPNGVAAGSAYVFTQAVGGWQQRAKLRPEDGRPGDEFGSALAVSGDGGTALIGARFDADPKESGDSTSDDMPDRRNAGSAYVFR